MLDGVNLRLAGLFRFGQESGHVGREVEGLRKRELLLASRLGGGACPKEVPDRAIEIADLAIDEAVLQNALLLPGVHVVDGDVRDALTQLHENLIGCEGIVESNSPQDLKLYGRFVDHRSIRIGRFVCEEVIPLR